MYTYLNIRDGLVEVNSKPYSVNELYVGGLVRGELTISKSAGLVGEITVEGEPTITYEYPGILVVGEWSSISGARVDIIERRKWLTVKYALIQRDTPEVKLILDNIESRLIVSFTPRRITLEYSGNLEILEEPFRLVLQARARK